MAKYIHAAKLGLGLLIFLIAARVAPAAEIDWRHDYNAARQEALQKNRPLLLDFGTQSCGWCKKMDATTYRDTAVAHLINQQFIAVKVDGNRDTYLTQSLAVDGFPTAVMASPDGNILDRVEGWLAPAPFAEHLKKVATISADWPAHAYAEANAALAKQDYARAIAWFKRLSTAPAAHPLQAKGVEQLAQLEGQATEHLNQAVQLHQQGREGEARETLGTVAKSYPGTHAAADAQGLLTTWIGQERPVQTSFQAPK